MKITRVYAGPDGVSHFDKWEISYEIKPDIGRQSLPMKANEVVFREKEGRHEGGWHCVPQKQLVVLFEGELEVETSDGDKRHFNAGDVFLCEDMTGQGHKVRGMNRKTLVIRLA